jgi:MYXO-CTERM domain-containing protein
MWENISFVNITATGGADAGLIYGLNTVPNNIQGLSFDNVHISAASHMKLWYASDVDLSGLTISVPPSDAYANAIPVSGAYLYAVTVPEPSTDALGLAGLAFVGSWLLRRRRAATPGRPR